MPRFIGMPPDPGTPVESRPPDLRETYLSPPPATGPPPLLGSYRGSIPAAAPQLGQQPQDFQVHPDQSDQQAEPGVPLHVLGGLESDPLLDEVEVQRRGLCAPSVSGRRMAWASSVA